MKLFVNILMLGLWISSLSANGVVPTDIVITGAGPNALVLKMSETLNNELDLVIKDRYGVVLHSENFTSGSQVAKKFDLSSLPDGDFFLVLANSIMETTYSFSIEGTQVVVDTDATKRSYKPIVTMDAGLVSVAYINLDNKKVKVTLLDELNNEVYTDILKGDGKLERSYDFSQLPYRDYQLVVTTGRHRVTRRMAL